MTIHRVKITVKWQDIVKKSRRGAVGVSLLAGPTTLSRPFSGAEVVMRTRAGPGLRPGVPFGEACGRRLERAAEELQVTVAERERYLAMFNIRLYRRKISLI